MKKNILFVIGLFLFSTCFAAGSGTAPTTQQNILSMLPMFLLLALFMYFMVIRPQTKRAKEQKNLLNNVKKGDEVLTVGGVLGKIEKINNDFIIINSYGTNFLIQKSAIVSCMPKGTIKSAE